MPPSILIVEDDRDLASAMCHAFAREGFTTSTVDTGALALATVHGGAVPDLMLLDLMLPDISGFEVCRQIRADTRTRDLPVLMVTARVDEIDRVVGFEVGADDYITKPFSIRELVLRVRAILRRKGSSPSTSDNLVCGRVRVDARGHRGWVDGQELTLTALEFRLLLALVSHADRVYTRDALLFDVWGMAADVTTRTVDTHIQRLREKLGPAAEQLWTLRGVGYRLSPDAPPSREAD